MAKSIENLINEALAKAAYGALAPPDNPTAKAKVLKAAVELEFELDEPVSERTFRNVVEGTSTNPVVLGLLCAFVTGGKKEEVKTNFANVEKFKQLASNYMAEYAQNAKAPVLDKEVLYTNNRTNANKRFQLWPVLLFLSGALSALSIYFLLKDSSSTKPNLTRVALLLPLDTAEYDKLNQGIGLLNFYDEHPDWSEFANIIPLDTENDNEKAWAKMKDEVAKGTRYFLATLSTTTVYLAQKIEESNDPRMKEVVFLATATSSAGFICSKNSIYRFYIRNNEQLPKLVEAYTAHSDTSKKVFLYYVDDESGYDTKGFLTERFDTLQLESLKISRSGKNGYQLEKPENLAPNAIIFLSAHGYALQVFIETAASKCRDCQIYATSTLATFNYDLLDSLAKKNQVYVAKPAVLEGSKSNTVSFLVKESLMLFLAAIQKTENQGDFHENWKQAVKERNKLESWKNGPISFDKDSLDLIVPVFVELLQSGSNK